MILILQELNNSRMEIMLLILKILIGLKINIDKYQ